VTNLIPALSAWTECGGTRHGTLDHHDPAYEVMIAARAERRLTF
jgi:hypothetical protein